MDAKPAIEEIGSANQPPAVTASKENRRKKSETITAAPDPLLQARQILANGNYRAFYTELNRSVWNVVAHKLELPGSEMNKHHISMKLLAKGWNRETIGILENILNECEMKLYTPNYSEQTTADPSGCRDGCY